MQFATIKEHAAHLASVTMRPTVACQNSVRQPTASPPAGRGVRERPHRRAAEHRDERAPLHSITSSARASTVVGMSRPSALAVLRLITSSYLVGACTGRSAGFSPL